MTITYEDALSKLQERAFGGSGVAAAPGDSQDDQEFFTEGPLMAGSSSAVEWFKKSLEDTESSALAILILVGAPGNGKSFIAKKVVDGLKDIDNKPDGLHHRTYSYKSASGRDLLVVNDASIPNSEPNVTLVDDINNAVSDTKLLLININRGILYQEINKKDVDTSSIGYLIINWIDKKENAGDKDLVLIVDKEDSKGSPLRNACVEGRSVKKEINITAVFMDSCSLLESEIKVVDPQLDSNPWPKIDTPYKIAYLHERIPDFSEATPAGQVLAQFVRDFPEPDSETNKDPFQANLKSLQSEKVRTGILTSIRLAEIASSKRMTYRELWGTISILLIGNTINNPSDKEVNPLKWLKEKNLETLEGKEKFREMLSLASIRLHQAIFGANDFFDSELVAKTSPVLQLTQKIDPIADALDWARPVYNSFYGQTEGKCILKAIMEELEEGALRDYITEPEEGALRDYITDFDLALDEVITEALNGENDWISTEKEKKKLIGWYGNYLIRMLAICKGMTSYYEELENWIQSWNYANTNERLSSKLERGIKILVSPRSNSENDIIYYPIFASKVEPIDEEAIGAQIAIGSTTDINFIAEPDGDFLLIKLNPGNVKIELDFPLLREAWSCSGGHTGITDQALLSTPRIERFRSAMLNSNTKNKTYLVSNKLWELIETDPASGK